MDLEPISSFTHLLDQRSKNPENIDEIDAEIRRLYVTTQCILYTDLCGFTGYVQHLVIFSFLQKMHQFMKLFVPIIEQFGGYVLKVEGDSVIVLFEQVEHAVQAVWNTLHELVEYNRDREEEECIRLCSGIGYGEILNINNVDLFGYEVNLASKLGEDIAEAEEILLSEAAKIQLCHQDEEFKYEELSITGKRRFMAYRLLPD